MSLFHYVKGRLHRLEALGVTIGPGFSLSRLRGHLGDLLRADSEVSLAEIVGSRVGYRHVYLSPGSPGFGGDIDLGFIHRSEYYSAQVKTFDIMSSSLGQRIAQLSRNFDVGYEGYGNIFSDRLFVGDTLAAQSLRRVPGIPRKASIGVDRFEPSIEDLLRGVLKIRKELRAKSWQLRNAPGYKLIVFDMRRSHIEPDLLTKTVTYALTHSHEFDHLACVAMLWYNFLAKSATYESETMLVPLAFNERFKFDRGILLPAVPYIPAKVTPFTLPTHMEFLKTGWQNLFAVEKGVITIDGVEYGPLFR